MKMTMKRIVLSAAMLATTFSVTGLAQTTPAAPPKLITVKVDVLLTRFEGDKALGASPFSLLVSGTHNVARMRIGVEVPTGTVTVSGRTETAFKTIGTQIDAFLSSMTPNEGRYPLEISISDTAVFSNDSSDRVARAELVKEAAAKGLARQRELFSKNLTTSASVDAAENKLRVAEVDVAALRKSTVVLPTHADKTAFRSFTSSNVLYLRDGQTQEMTIGTDRTSGETVKAAVTLTVLK